MLNADADYAQIVSLLTKQQLAPYVSYAKSDVVDGFGKHTGAGHVVVRVSDGTIVSGDSSGIEAGDYHDRSNPVSHPTFVAACYRAVTETADTYAGRPALKLTLVPTCQSKPHDVDYPFTTLYADPQTLHPLDVSGTVKPTADSKDVMVALDQHFADFNGRVMPTQLKVDVSGSGWMFWLQVHVTETYGDYQFLNSPSA
jgi:hypothetical protein